MSIDAEAVLQEHLIGIQPSSALNRDPEEEGRDGDGLRRSVMILLLERIPLD